MYSPDGSVSTGQLQSMTNRTKLDTVCTAMSKAMCYRGRPNFGYGFGYGAETTSKVTWPGFGFGQCGFGQHSVTAVSGTWFRNDAVG